MDSNTDALGNSLENPGEVEKIAYNNVIEAIKDLEPWAARSLLLSVAGEKAKEVRLKNLDDPGATRHVYIEPAEVSPWPGNWLDALVTQVNRICLAFFILWVIAKILFH